MSKGEVSYQSQDHHQVNKGYPHHSQKQSHQQQHGLSPQSEIQPTKDLQPQGNKSNQLWNKNQQEHQGPDRQDKYNQPKDKGHGSQDQVHRLEIEDCHQPEDRGNQPQDRGHQTENENCQPQRKGCQPENKGYQPEDQSNQPQDHGPQTEDGNCQPGGKGQPENKGHQPEDKGSQLQGKSCKGYQVENQGSQLQDQGHQTDEDCQPQGKGCQPENKGYQPEDYGSQLQDQGHRTNEDCQPQGKGCQPENKGHQPEDQSNQPHYQGHQTEDENSQQENNGHQPENQGNQPQYQGHQTEDEDCQPQGKGSQQENKGRQPEDQSNQLQDESHQTEDEICQPQGKGCQPEDKGYQPEDKGNQLQDQGHQKDEDCQPQEKGCQPENKGHQPEDQVNQHQNKDQPYGQIHHPEGEDEDNQPLHMKHQLQNECHELKDRGHQPEDQVNRHQNKDHPYGQIHHPKGEDEDNQPLHMKHQLQNECHAPKDKGHQPQSQGECIGQKTLLKHRTVGMVKNLRDKYKHQWDWSLYRVVSLKKGLKPVDVSGQSVRNEWIKASSNIEPNKQIYTDYDLKQKAKQNSISAEKLHSDKVKSFVGGPSRNEKSQREPRFEAAIMNNHNLSEELDEDSENTTEELRDLDFDQRTLNTKQQKVTCGQTIKEEINPEDIEALKKMKWGTSPTDSEAADAKTCLSDSSGQEFNNVNVTHDSIEPQAKYLQMAISITRQTQDLNDDDKRLDNGAWGPENYDPQITKSVSEGLHNVMDLKSFQQSSITDGEQKVGPEVFSDKSKSSQQFTSRLDSSDRDRSSAGLSQNCDRSSGELVTETGERKQEKETFNVRVKDTVIAVGTDDKTKSSEKSKQSQGAEDTVQRNERADKRNEMTSKRNEMAGKRNEKADKRNERAGKRNEVAAKRNESLRAGRRKEMAGRRKETPIKRNETIIIIKRNGTFISRNVGHTFSLSYSVKKASKLTFCTKHSLLREANKFFPTKELQRQPIVPTDDDKNNTPVYAIRNLRVLESLVDNGIDVLEIELPAGRDLSCKLENTCAVDTSAIIVFLNIRLSTPVQERLETLCKMKAKEITKLYPMCDIKDCEMMLDKYREVKKFYDLCLEKKFSEAKTLVCPDSTDMYGTFARKAISFLDPTFLTVLSTYCSKCDMVVQYQNTSTGADIMVYDEDIKSQKQGLIQSAVNRNLFYVKPCEEQRSSDGKCDGIKSIKKIFPVPPIFLPINFNWVRAIAEDISPENEIQVGKEWFQLGGIVYHRCDHFMARVRLLNGVWVQYPADKEGKLYHDTGHILGAAINYVYYVHKPTNDATE